MSEPSLTITPHPAAAVPGVAVAVSITVDPGSPTVVFTGFTLSLDGIETASVLVMPRRVGLLEVPPPTAPYSVTLTITPVHTGARTMTATGVAHRYSDGGAWPTVSSAPVPITVLATTVAITGPTAGTKVPLTEAGGAVALTATITPGNSQFAGSGGLMVTAAVDTTPQAGVKLASQNDTQWSGLVPISPTPLGVRVITVVCTTVNAPTQVLAQTSVTVIAEDAAPPTFDATLDPPTDQMHATPNGDTPLTYTVVLGGHAHDMQSGMVGGSATIDWALTPDGARTPAVPTPPAAPNAWSNWTITLLKLAALGPTNVYLWATDAAGNATPNPTQYEFVAVADFGTETVDDRLDELHYLEALLGFAATQIAHPAAGGHYTPITVADLVGVLRQPVDRLSAPVPVGTPDPALVNELRIPIEVVRADISANNKTTPAGDTLVRQYRQAAYRSLLSAAGADFTELQLARGADPATRQALAERLGIPLYGLNGTAGTRPDQLDALTLDDTQLSEPVLETLFGLPDTTVGLDPLRPPITPRLLLWRREAQLAAWQRADTSSLGPVAYHALVDPDVITVEDIRPTAPQAPSVTTLLTTRTTLLSKQHDTLTAARAAAGTDQDKLIAMLGAGFPPGTAATVLTDLRQQETQGADITAGLTDLGLTRRGYNFLLQLQSLAATQPPAALITDDEWGTATDILVGAYRTLRYPTWRTEEIAASIILTPDLFTAKQSPELSAGRIDPQARVDWERSLSARADEQQALDAAASEMVRTTEQKNLPTLRDALVAHATPPQGSASDTGELLSSQYFLDVMSSGINTTTRRRQAIASIQALIVGVRSGTIAALAAAPVASTWALVVLHPPDGFPPGHLPTFDYAWRNMVDIDHWRSALSSYLFPETALDPAQLPAHPVTAGDGNTKLFPFDTLRQNLGLSPQASSSPSTPSASALQPVDVENAVNAYLGVVKEVVNPDFSSVRAFYQPGARDPGHQEALAGWSKNAAEASNTGNVGAELVREMFWAVPVLAGQVLRSAGHHTEALDWLWIVYPYTDRGTTGSSYHVINDELQSTDSTNTGSAFDPAAPLDPFGLISGRVKPFTRNAILTVSACLSDYADAQFTSGTDADLDEARDIYDLAATLLAQPALEPIAWENNVEAELEPPQLTTLTKRIANQRAKLRQGRTINGLPRLQTTTTTGVTPPTPYHYKTLDARAQQLVQQAAQLEAQYLTLLEKFDAGTLRVSDAQNANAVATLQQTVHQDQIQQAQQAAIAAADQQTKTQDVVTSLSNAIAAGPNPYEANLLNNYKDLRTAQDIIAAGDAAIGLGQAAATTTSNPVLWVGIGAGIAESAGVTAKTIGQVWANNLQEKIASNQLQAGIANRQQEWALQLVAAKDDVTVAAAQRAAANEQVSVALAEGAVADQQAQQAANTLTMLQNQFTNPQLYLWMSNTIGGIYRYVLQQATATARLARDQLTFERAQPVVTTIAADYWNLSAGPSAGDQRGMTGAERLQNDLDRLEQEAIFTDARRLNLSHTFSLAQMLPVEFVSFRATGELTFASPASWFDQDFPGHYHRLLRQVHIGIVGLIPANRGIRAQLSSTGLSRVTEPRNGGGFTEITLHRDPTTIAFTSPVAATGVFDVDLQPDLLLPFEGGGVDTTWTLELPKAANPFDYRSLSDVLVTFDYTALFDADLRAAVIGGLNANRQRGADSVFSLADDFPDQWYSLQQPPDSGTTRSAVITLDASDLPVNIPAGSLQTTAVALQLVSSGDLPTSTVTLYQVDGSSRPGGSAQTDTQGLASTRRGAQPWISQLLGRNPVGDWQITVDGAASALFDNHQVDDILLVVSWSGDLPAWPS